MGTSLDGKKVLVRDSNGKLFALTKSEVRTAAVDVRAKDAVRAVFHDDSVLQRPTVVAHYNEKAPDWFKPLRKLGKKVEFKLGEKSFSGRLVGVTADNQSVLVITP